MRKILAVSMLILFLAGVAFAANGPNAKSLNVSTARSFVVLQNTASVTTQKIAYVLSLEDAVEVVAWRFSNDVWERVWPSPVEANSDSVVICPTGFTLPIEGQFDALTVRGTTTGGSVEVQWYK